MDACNAKSMTTKGVTHMEDNKRSELLGKLVSLLRDEGMLHDVCIYAGDRRYFSEEHDWHKGLTMDEKLGLCYQEGIDVREFLEYSNPDTLTVTFEGPLYAALNYGDGKLERKLDALFGKYGLYMEYGHAWSFSLWEE